MLEGKLTAEELAILRRSFEIIGDVVIIDIPDEVIHAKDDIIEAILRKHKHIKTILRKKGEVSGDFRIADYEVIYGEETETVVKEHGCRFIVDPTKVYYSVKLAGERERVARLVTEGEKVLVMFSGVGPYPIVIARLSKPSEVTGIELNPIAVEYFKKNVRLNKVENKVRVVEGDVRDILPVMEEEFDRILMPAPNTAESFVELLPGKIKRNGYIHYYTFAGEEEEESGILGRRITELFGKNDIDVRIVSIRRCGHFAPYVHRYVIDLEAV